MVDIKSASGLILFLIKDYYSIIANVIKKLYENESEGLKLDSIDDLFLAKSKIAKYILQNPKYSDQLIFKFDPKVEKQIDSCWDLMCIHNDEYLMMFKKIVDHGGFKEENFKLTQYDFVAMKQSKQSVELDDNNNFGKLLKLICNIRDSWMGTTLFILGVIDKNGAFNKSNFDKNFDEYAVKWIFKQTKDVLDAFFSENGCFAKFMQKAMENKNIAAYFRNIDLMTGKSIDEFNKMLGDMNAQIKVTGNNISIVYGDNVETTKTTRITEYVKSVISKLKPEQPEKLENKIINLSNPRPTSIDNQSNSNILKFKFEQSEKLENKIINLSNPRPTSVNNLSNSIDNQSNSKSSKLSKRRILLLIGIVVSFLVSVGSALNSKFLIIVIANPWSMILAVGALGLFATLTYIANRYKVIKISKLFCMDSGGSFFNLRKPLENSPESEKGIFGKSKYFE